jgi:hypothetical protein
LVNRIGFVARFGSHVADDRPALAALRLSQHYQLAMRHVWNDAVRDPILSGSFSCRIGMESTCIRSALLCYRIRYLRADDVGGARAAFKDFFCERSREEIFAFLNHLCACPKLGVFAAALAQFLGIKE